MNSKLDFTSQACQTAKKYIVKNTYIPKDLKDKVVVDKDGVITFDFNLPKK